MTSTSTSRTDNGQGRTVASETVRLARFLRRQFGADTTADINGVITWVDGPSRRTVHDHLRRYGLHRPGARGARPVRLRKIGDGSVTVEVNGVSVGLRRHLSPVSAALGLLRAPDDLFPRPGHARLAVLWVVEELTMAHTDLVPNSPAEEVAAMLITENMPLSILPRHPWSTSDAANAISEMGGPAVVRELAAAAVR